MFPRVKGNNDTADAPSGVFSHTQGDWLERRTNQSKVTDFLQNHGHDLVIMAQESRTSVSFCLSTSYLTYFFITLSTFPDVCLREQFLKMLLLISTPLNSKI